MDRTSRHRAFAISLGTLALVVLVGAGLYTWQGHAVIRSACAGESFEFLNAKYAEPPKPVAYHLQRADEFVAATTACSLAALVLLSLAYGVANFRRGVLARTGLTLAGLAVFWVGFELLAAPHLVRQLRLINYNIVRDPMHLPPKPEQPVPGWNSDAIRETPEPEEFRAEDLNLLFLGDSFTYGMRVQAADTFAKKVEAMLQARFADRVVRVANFGWTSSSPVLSYRRLADDGDDYAPDLVALFVDMTDFHDDVKWEGMLQRRGIYAFYDKLPIALKLLETYAPDLYWGWWSRSNGGLPKQRYFITERPLEETREWFEPLMGNVDAIHAWCEERGIPFALFVLPRYHQYSDVECPNDYELDKPGREHAIVGPHSQEPFRYFAERAPELGYPVFPLLEDFATSDVSPHCFDDDPHWNPAGHSIAAEAIARDLGSLLEAP